jgi:hypothetical protein
MEGQPMTRREIIAAALSALPLAAKALDRSRLSIIGDEAGDTLEDWIRFAHQHKLRWLEMRAMLRDGAPAFLDSLPASEVRSMARRLKGEGIGVSFYNSALLKYTLPGTEPVQTEKWYDRLYARLKLTPELLYAQREERLRRAIATTQALGATQLRAFTFWRVRNPRMLYPRLVELFTEMGSIAEKEGCRILIEIEHATNVATSEEMRDLLRELPSPAIGINWDPQNARNLEPDVFPAGYLKLPRLRIGNVQIKAEGLFGPGKLDWPSMIRTLEADGYQGLYGLETHHGQGAENHRMSHRAMAELIRITDPGTVSC